MISLGSIRHVAVPTPTGTISVPVQQGKVVMIAGPNGTGKSSLLHAVARSAGSPRDVEVFSGHRQIHFNSDDIDTVGQSLDQFPMQLFQNLPHHNRFRSAWGEQHLKSVIKRVLNRQVQDNHEIINLARETGRSIDDITAERPQALTLLNSVLETAGLPVRIVLAEGGLRAQRGEVTYGVDQLSDGERAALLLAGAVLVRPNQTTIAIDEPERHLHPSIAGPLIAATVRARPDLAFILATHDLGLVEVLEPSVLVHVLDSFVQPGTAPPGYETRVYSLSITTGGEGISEELRRAILGSRRSLLLVEGDVTGPCTRTSTAALMWCRGVVGKRSLQR